jgi:hypothetical protein
MSLQGQTFGYRFGFLDTGRLKGDQGRLPLADNWPIWAFKAAITGMMG